MLLELERFKNNIIINSINKFLRSNYFLLIVGLFMAISAIFGLELLYYYIFILICTIYSTFFAEDFLHIIPITFTGYMTFSRGNNPAGYEGSKLFNGGSTLIQLIIILSIFSCCIISRIIYNIIKKKYINYPRFTIGLVILGIAYMLGGLCSDLYKLNTISFGAIEFASIALFYFIYSFTVDKTKIKKDYFAYMLVFIGLGLTLEIFGIYIEIMKYVKANGITFNRTYIYSGWGMYNNIGGMMVLFIPAPIYLLLKNKNIYKGIILNICAFLFLAATIATLSRSSIIVASFMYIFAIIYVLCKQDDKERIVNLSFNLAILCFLVFVFVIQIEWITDTFNYLLQSDTISARNDTYKYGIDVFKAYPIFGRGFYSANGFYVWGINSGKFLPPRYHNTFIQLLASAGIIGLIVYLIHRADTLICLIKNRSEEKFFVFLTIVVILLTSQLDCHFFNFGPGIIYSLLLFFLEAYDKQEKISKEKLISEN